MADSELPDEGPNYSSGQESDEPSNRSYASARSDDEGEDLMANAEADYRPMEHLDQYEDDGLDDEVDEEAIADRLAAIREAEKELERRDAQTGKRKHPGALYEDLDQLEPTRRKRGRRDRVEAAQNDEDAEPVAIDYVDLDALKGPVQEQIAQEPVRREVERRFRRFLRTWTDESGDHVYRNAIRDMCKTNKQSLLVSFSDASHAMPAVAMMVVDAPKHLIDILDKVALEVVLEDYPEFINVHKEVFVRWTGLPVMDAIRDLRHFHLGLMVRTAGVVTRRTGVFPQLQMVKYDCNKCGYTLGPFYQNSEQEVKPSSCPQCQSKGPFQVNVQETVYRNFQRITLQESPGSVPAGRLPRQKDVVLLDDLIDCCRPGEEIEVVGVYSNSYNYFLNVKSGFPVFSTLIEANSVFKRGEQYAATKLTDEDKQEIQQLARHPRIAERIVKSIAPSIYGLSNVKLGVALALFGGQEKHPSSSVRLRGDINMLLLGDPGTAKSQLLKYVEKVAQRAVYTTGKGASAVGLTAAVQKDPITREWTLEGGALVLADKGVCIIDEFDKMNDQDRVSIHEAMEQQTISISKAGIVTTLQARCAVLAAANPIGGRYNPSRTFAENVELSDPILSRFDLLCVIRDVVDPVNDEKLANFVVDSHMRSHTGAVDEEEQNMEEETDEDIIPQELLKKYITFAKQACRPRMQNTDYDKIAQVYAELRREAAVTHSMPIAVRHLESMIRVSEAHARMHLREYVTNDDIDVAIRTLLESFVASQKYSVQKALSRRFKRFLTFKKDFNELTLVQLQSLVRDTLRTLQIEGREPQDEWVRIPIRLLQDKMRDYNITDLQPFFESTQFQDAGFALDEHRRNVLLAH